MTLSRIEELAARKQELLDRSESERDQVARVWYRWQARTALAQQVTGILKNPLVLAGLGVFALKMPWRRTYKFGGWFWRGWKLFRSVRRMFI